MQQITQKFTLDIMWGKVPFQHIHKLARGNTGGILVDHGIPRRLMFWTQSMVTFVPILCRNKDGDRYRWAFSRVYGPCDQSASTRLWEEFSRVMEEWKVPWCLDGDFNVVRFPSK